MIHFVLGGARSGKSSFAERHVLSHAKSHQKTPVYIATAANNIDDEMSERINKHQVDRGDGWQLIESPIRLADTINTLEPNNIYLLDCLTLWLNNQLYAVHEKKREIQQAHLQAEIDKLVINLLTCHSDIVIVSNEIGLGVVPLGESTRLYVDYCGWLNQKVAELADEVTLVTAGIPLSIKKAY